jgi:hypothetical protein
MQNEEKDPATLPGGAAFDVDNASEADYKKHKTILQRRAEVAELTPVTATLEATAQAAPVSVEPNPNDIRAMKDGEVRYFTPTTWDLMGDNRFGWEPSVAKPANI